MGTSDDIRPGQPWQVVRFQPEHARGVRALFLGVYGEGYPVRTFIDPDLLVEENRAGRTVSSVAVTPAGDVVGHNALYRSAAWEGIYESGAGVVHRAYRGGKGVFTAVVEHGRGIAETECQAGAIFGEPVCHHVYAQRVSHRLGWRTMALEVDLMPASAHAVEGSPRGRVSALLDFATVSPRPHRVYLPESYANTLRWLYSELDDQRALVEARGEAPVGVPSEVEVSTYGFAQVARMAVRRVGPDLADAVARRQEELASAGVRVFHVWLDLSRPDVGFAVEALHRGGHFLGGVLPRWFDTDGLLLQRLLAPPAWSRIQIQFDRARRLLELVREDWCRWGATEAP